MKTIRVVAVAAMIGSTTSRVPATAASSGASPARRFRYTFSNTTIALSTMRPKPIARPMSVSTLSVKPPK